MNSARTIVLAVTTATLLGSALLAPAHAAAPVELQPDELTRGADIAIPHIEGDDFVDGARRIDVGGERAHLLGRAGRAWLVGTSNEDGNGGYRIVRVRRDDSTRVIKRGIPFFELEVSENGRFFVHAGRGGRQALPIRVFSSRTGALAVERDFANYPQVLGMDGPRVLLSTWTDDAGIKSWDIRTGAVRKVSTRPANLVDIGNDLLAVYTKDPYLGGCTVLSTLSTPRTRLWKSCRERVEAFSPDGNRMATVAILSDGIGPSAVRERETDGTLLGVYTTNWFGRIGFESDTDLLLEVNGDNRAATVRCSERSCQNATNPVPVRQPRLNPARPSGRSGSVAPAAGAWQTPQS